MVVYSHKYYIVNIVGIGIIVLLMSVFFLSLGAALLSILLFVLSILTLAAYGVAVGRTIVFSKDSCTIKIGRIEKVFAWENIAIKRIESAHLGLRNQYHNGGVFFSIHKVNKPRWCDPCLYCMLFHPFSCFWVYFITPNAKGNKDSNPSIYEVNKEHFLHQLSSWGIELGS